MSEKIDWSKAPEGATHFLHDSDEYSSCWLKYGFAISARNAYGSDKWTSSGGSMRAIDAGIAIPRPTTPSWSGEGLPPVGVVCEVRQKTPHSSAFDWEKCTIGLTNIGANGCVQVCTIDHRGDFAIYYPEIDIVEFRPVRTPEQIAEDEREAFARTLTFEMGKDSSSPNAMSQARRMYDLGYRKQ